MIIKRWDSSLNSGSGGWVEQYPKTTYGLIYDGESPIFDNGKLKASYLPDAVFDGIKFIDTIASETDLESMVASAYDDFGLDGMKGSFGIASTNITLVGIPDSFQINGSTAYWKFDYKVGEEGGEANPDGNVYIERGDWLVLISVTGSGASILDPYVLTFGFVNNQYRMASAENPGIVKLGATQNTAVTSTPTAFTNAGRYYPIQTDNNNRLIVNVPWTDTTYPEASFNTSGTVKIGASKYSTAKTVNTPTDTVDRFYSVVMNNDGRLIVNVPWVDNNTIYSEANSSTLGLVKIPFTKRATSATVNTEQSTAGRWYGVSMNDNGTLIVNIPWTDTKLSTEEVEDIVGGLVNHNGSLLVYDDANAQLNLSYPMYYGDTLPTTNIQANALGFEW